MSEVTRDPHAAIEHAWWSSIHGRNLTDYSQREMFEMGFRRGAQWSTRMTSGLSPHVAAFSEFVIWLMERPEEQDDWDRFVEPPPLEPVHSNGSGSEDDPW